MAQCGSCSVLIDGVETRSCITPVADAVGKDVTTIEGLPKRWAARVGSDPETVLHPVQRAWIEEQTPLCGFCQSGMMIKATELLEANPAPSRDEIVAAYTTARPSPHLCRCGSYKAIIEAVQRASEIMRLEADSHDDAPGPDAKATPFTTTSNPILDPWIYDRVPHVEERGHGMIQLGEKASPIHVGLRSKSIRTPGQAQQNFARELAISEAAVSAGRDPLQFRLDHTTDRRLINVLQQVRQASGWDERPQRPASDTGASPVVQGRGVSAIFRHSAYWACVCEVAVDRESGKVGVRRYTVAVDPGIVINPLQLRRQIEGGAVMGLSRALFDETHFDESGVTDQDWASTPIPTMADLPEITVVLLNNPAAATFGGGSEAASARRRCLGMLTTAYFGEMEKSAGVYVNG
jgi:aerobic-type carbon monoxide dehydrogenase small subunit (CoxS/CutS family)